MKWLLFPLSVPALGTVAGLAMCLLSARARAQPPAWPDARVLANGCYVSTAAYLAKLRAHFPEVAARAENVRLPGGRLHTIAVVEWEGGSWLRDLFVGVAPARGDVQRSFDEALAEWRARGGRHPYQERHVSTSAERHAEVAAAAELLAGQHPEIIALAGRAGAIPVLSWTTPAGELALYEPSRGTAVGLTQRAPRAVAMQIFGHEPGAQP